MANRWKYERNHELRKLLEDAIQQSKTTTETLARLGMSYRAFRRHAQAFGLWKTGWGGAPVGTTHVAYNIIPLHEILEGKHPTYSGKSLKDRLIRQGLKKNACENETCGISEWQGQPLTCQIDHIDGDSTNHRWENLRILCPNCHSQTPTWGAKKRPTPT